MKQWIDNAFSLEDGAGDSLNIESNSRLVSPWQSSIDAAPGTFETHDVNTLLELANNVIDVNHWFSEFEFQFVANFFDTSIPVKIMRIVPGDYWYHGIASDYACKTGRKSDDYPFSILLDNDHFQILQSVVDDKVTAAAAIRQKG